MQNDFVAGIEELNAVTVKSIKTLGDIQLRFMEKLTERQIALTSDYVRDGVQQMQNLAEAKDFGKMVESQTGFVSEFNQRLVDDARKTTEILTESKTELSKWFEEGVKFASSNPFAQVFTRKAA